LSVYKNIVRSILFNLEAENAHETACDFLALLHRSPFICNLLRKINQVHEAKPIELFGLTFPNRIGLAAGFDKNGKFPRAAEAFGFGHIEIGTVTPQAQPGNPKPRLFRVSDQNALINRMGFNNLGAKAMYESIHSDFPKQSRTVPLGINIGKAKTTPIENAVRDYLACFDMLADQADYFTINVSSPNTKNLRSLQSDDELKILLKALQQRNNQRAESKQEKPIPMILKIAPDLSYDELDILINNVIEHRYDGIIATNTTIQRPTHISLNEDGGFSGGDFMHELSMRTITHIVKQTNGNLPIIAAGGINNVETAREKIEAGASLTQIYTGWIYEGPFLPKRIATGLRK